jgi:hypothetical protein
MNMVEQNKKKSCWMKYLLGFICGVPIVLLLIWASVTFWFGPRYVEAGLTEDLSVFWDGKIIVDGIDFRLFHPITVDSIILENKTGKPCIQAKKVTLLFKKWPSSDPQLTGLKLDHLDLTLGVKKGNLDVPFRQTVLSPSGHEESSVPLDSFTVENLAIHLSNEKTVSMILDDLSFSAVHMPTGYELSLKQKFSNDSDNFLFSGSMIAKGSMPEFYLVLTKHISRHIAADILSLLDIPCPFEYEGNLSADIHFKGETADFGDIQPQGTIMLNDGSCVNDQKVWAEKLNAVVQLNGSYLQVEKWTADSFGGQVEGNLDAEMRQKNVTQLHGQITGKNIQASSVMGTSTVAKKTNTGIWHLIMFLRPMKAICNR